MLSDRFASRWPEWYRRALPSYWIYLAAMTHFPKPQLGGPPQSDKVLHFLAFGVLTFLWWHFGEATGLARFRHFALRSGILLALYAAADEWTQQYVGRGTSLADWITDVASIALVLTILEWGRRRAVRVD